MYPLLQIMSLPSLEYLLNTRLIWPTHTKDFAGDTGDTEDLQTKWVCNKSLWQLCTKICSSREFTHRISLSIAISTWLIVYFILMFKGLSCWPVPLLGFVSKKIASKIPQLVPDHLGSMIGVHPSGSKGLNPLLVMLPRTILLATLPKSYSIPQHRNHGKHHEICFLCWRILSPT